VCLRTPTHPREIRQNARLWAVLFPPLVLIPSAAQRAIVRGKMKDLIASGKCTVKQSRSASRSWWPSQTARNTTSNASIKADTAHTTKQSWWGFSTAPSGTSQASKPVEETLEEIVLEDFGEPVSRVRFASFDVAGDPL